MAIPKAVAMKSWAPGDGGDGLLGRTLSVVVPLVVAGWGIATDHTAKEHNQSRFVNHRRHQAAMMSTTAVWIEA